MARELGGARGAQLVASHGCGCSILHRRRGSNAVRLFRRPLLGADSLLRRSPAQIGRSAMVGCIGCAIGLGLEAKYSILFLVSGLIVGLAATRAP
jgi:hypothetical protein